MLKGNAKIWAVVVVICMIVQFATATLPGIVETFDTMDAEFEQKIEEEKLKATKPVVEPTVGEVIEDNGVANVDEMVAEENVGDESESDGTSPLTTLGIVMLFFFVLFFAFMMLG